MATIDPKVLDVEKALSITDGDRELLSQLYEMYLEQTRNAIPEIEAAISRKDAKRLEFVAHSLKGASASIAAETVRAVAYRLENLGKSGGFEEAQAVLKELKESINITNEFISRQLSELRSGKGE